MTKRLSRRSRIMLGLVALGAGVPTVALASVHLTEANTALTGTSIPTLGGSSTVQNAAAASTTSSSSSSSSSSTTGSKGLPADKVTVGGSTVEVFGPNQDVVLLQAQMKTSSVADLLFAATAECSIVTSVTTTGNDQQQAEARIVMWVTIDGKSVGVEPAQPGGSDSGQVTFCNRVYRSTTSGFPTPLPMQSPNPVINTYEATKDANAFNWMALNVGTLNGAAHVIQLHAMLEQSVTDPTKDTAQAMVGPRTLVVNPTQSAQNQVQ